MKTNRILIASAAFVMISYSQALATDYQYNDKGQLVSDGTYSYSYNDKGYISSKTKLSDHSTENFTYTYDENYPNRVLTQTSDKVSTANGVTGNIVYRYNYNDEGKVISESRLVDGIRTTYETTWPDGTGPGKVPVTIKHETPTQQSLGGGISFNYNTDGTVTLSHNPGMVRGIGNIIPTAQGELIVNYDDTKASTPSTSIYDANGRLIKMAYYGRFEGSNIYEYEYDDEYDQYGNIIGSTVKEIYHNLNGYSSMAAFEASGDEMPTSISTTTNTYTWANPRWQIPAKRIYTIKEATEALGKNNKNTFSIKYR